MNRLKISAILLAFVVLFSGCSNAAGAETTAESSVEQTTESSSSLPSREFFENLDTESSLEEIVDQIGDYSIEGSGTLYHVWLLDDGSKAKIVFNSEGVIEFIYIVDGDNSERIYDRENS